MLNSTAVLISFGGFLALVVLGAILAVLGRRQTKTGGDQVKVRRQPIPSTRSVTIFMHREAEANPALVPAVIGIFRDAGFEVSPGRTDLPQHQSGVWIHGGTQPDRTLAVWMLGTLGLTAQIDETDDRASLQVIIGVVEVEREKVNAEKRAATAVEVERNSFKAALEATQREREDIRGTLAAERDKARAERDDFEKRWRELRATFANNRARWFADKTREAKWDPPVRVTIRFGHYNDYDLVKKIEEHLGLVTDWPIQIDASNSPVIPPSDALKVIFASGIMQEFDTICAAFAEMGIVPDGSVGRRSEDRNDNRLIIEVRPTRTG